MSTEPFERLHPAVQHHIVNSLGWSFLRPTQRDAIGPILDGQHCILLAPTAGGKTEAAMFPLLSRVLSDEWRDLSILYVCPIKALLNNLEPRLSRYFGLVGRSAGVWHGDIAQTAKQRILKSPPDLLLTTPESLEGMLISTDRRRRQLISGVQAIVVDELHAFCGDDRGWHVRCLVRKIRALTGRPVQIIGLTATVANPDRLIRWLTYGEPAVTVGEGAPGTQAEVTLDYVGPLENAATVIARAHPGEKRLVFCDSRSKVEELAALLRSRDVRTFVSHSSLSADERRQAEKAFAEESGCVIVATSTLELGIDVGDLDRVIQIDAPATVAAFLQRMGRTGRRAGAQRNCLFLATEEEGFLIAAAIVRLWRNGFVEAIDPPPKPCHLVAQQALALILQHGGLAEAALRRALSELFPEIEPGRVGEAVGYMVETGVLWRQDGILAMGPTGEAEFGRRHFEAVVSTFTTPLLIAVIHGQKELGYVDPMSLQAEAGTPPVLILAGRYWRVIAQDWESRIAWVEPSDDKGKAAWFGTSRPLGYELCQTIKAILQDGEVPATLTRRAEGKRDEIRGDFAFPSANHTLLRKTPTRWEWWTYAGAKANWVLADLCRATGHEVGSFDNFCLRLKGPLRLPNRLPALDPIDGFPEAGHAALKDASESLKFGTCLPVNLRCEVLAARLRDPARALEVMNRRLDDTMDAIDGDAFPAAYREFAPGNP